MAYHAESLPIGGASSAAHGTWMTRLQAASLCQCVHYLLRDAACIVMLLKGSSFALSPSVLIQCCRSRTCPACLHLLLSRLEAEATLAQFNGRGREALQFAKLVQECFTPLLAAFETLRARSGLTFEQLHVLCWALLGE